MDKQAYQDMVFHQDNHWWFKARRKILKSIIKSYIYDTNLSILEIGCGTGGNLSMLESFGEVVGVEMNEFAVNYAKEQGYQNITKGWLPDNMPNQKKFDLICMFDVLEHIEKDTLSLDVVRNYLKPGGILIITVPAFNWLYGPHDKKLHHFRRYSKVALQRTLHSTQMLKIKSSYYNTLLFPLALAVRVIDIFRMEKEAIGYSVPHPFINNLLYRIFSLERYLLPKFSLPFGVSLMAVYKNN